MKRIGILSDTHSTWDERFARHFAECDEVWHAGDIGDRRVIEKLQRVVPVVRAVAGNIDNPLIAPKQLIFDVEGVRVCLMHITPNTYVKPAGAPVKMLVTGHSHILKV